MATEVPFLVAISTLFTVGEFAAPDTAIQPVPWDTPDFQTGSGTERRDDLTRFVDDATRPRPFGGETMTLRNNTGATAGAEECLEIAPAGWDAATGTFNPQCADPWTSETRFTGVVNHENDGGGQTVRPQEVGRRDNREAVGVATIRRLPAGGWDVPGFGWFEHKSGPIGCLMLRMVVNWDLVQEASEEDLRLEQLGKEFAEIYNNPCEPGVSPAQCAARHAWARLMHTDTHRRAVGWRLIAQWRYGTIQSLRNAMPDYSEYRLTRLEARGRGPGDLRNDRCYTAPIGEDGYNEKLAATASDQVGAGEWLNPAWSGKTYWGSNMQDDAWWTAAGHGHDYHYFAEVRGAVTKLVQADAQARTGETEPFPLDLGHDYAGDGVRRGQYTFREFACPTADHAGYYGAGVTHMGPQMLGHRDAPEGRAWSVRDSLIDPNRAERRYPTGTPCIDESESPVSQLTGDPLSRYYNVQGSNPDTLQPGGERCFEARRPTEDEIDQGVNPRAWLPVDGEPGQWSVPGRGGLDGRYYLEYSGDPETGTQSAGDPKMRPTP